jgi:hypothetical protein
MLTPKKKALKRALKDIDSEKNNSADAPMEQDITMERDKSQRVERRPKSPIEFKGTYYSPDGLYKTKVKKRYDEEDQSSKEKRTFKGVLLNVEKPKYKKQKQEEEKQLIYKT